MLLIKEDMIRKRTSYDQVLDKEFKKSITIFDSKDIHFHYHC